MFEMFSYIAVMLAVILGWFLIFKRPIYEGILISIVVLLCLTGRWVNLGAYINKAMTTSLLYSMMAFSATVAARCMG